MSRPSDSTGALTPVREAIDIARVSWARPLATAYVRDFASVAPFFPGNPREPAAWRETIARVQRAPRDRARLVGVLQRQLARGAPPYALEAAAELGQPTSVAIVTGQQAGVFGGPLYTLLKAVTAIQLACRVRVDHGVPAVPVFWVEAEDHDWAESARPRSSTTKARSARSRCRICPAPARSRWRRLRLDQRVEDTLASLESILARTEFSEEVMAALRRRYRPGAGMAAAFAGWLDDLLGREGLVVFESADVAAKPIVADLFGDEIAHPGRAAQLARDAGERLRALGYPPQVEATDAALPIFYLDGEGRRAIRHQDGHFAAGTRTFSAQALDDEARANPEHFSPNVLLRPVVQDWLFPTICYVTGPNELAYLAQLGGVYRALGVETPLFAPRASATLLDSGAVRFLERHGLPLDALQIRDDSVLNGLLERQLPASIEAMLQTLSRDVADATARLKDPVASVDPTLAGAVDTTRDRMLDTLKTLHSKIIQAAKRKDDTLRRQFVRARALAFPGTPAGAGAECRVLRQPLRALHRPAAARDPPSGYRQALRSRDVGPAVARQLRGQGPAIAVCGPAIAIERVAMARLAADDVWSYYPQQFAGVFAPTGVFCPDMATRVLSRVKQTSAERLSLEG